MESERSEEILPQLNFGYVQSLGRMCGLNARDARSLIGNGMVDIPSLIYRFFDAGDRNDQRWQSFRQHALCLCMLSHFLFASSFGGASIRLIEVAQGLKEGKNCIAMVLAETLMGLDAFHRRETTRFAGSPLLLQVMFPSQAHICICSHHSALGLDFFSQKPLSFFSLIAHLSILYFLIFHPSPDMVDGQATSRGLLPCLFSPRLFLSAPSSECL
ncbi:hypothetical protein LOK49_LG08G03443 [Camellia lanceoleosa]|uniref:Uncharacterized protein n=1 Tax=Camellia lanceoleosa TaxID=1840588 RepID=A0ACC0GQ49_9ERIC|nr:hypothetical protein LOK49_LG08G03443 [Camellia lanceoleosa]